VSYHQNKVRMGGGRGWHTCLHCRGRSRSITFYALMGGYYHYECWLELGRQNVRDAVQKHRVQITSDVPDKPVPAPATGFGSQIEIAWNQEYLDARERRRAIQARMEAS